VTDLCVLATEYPTDKSPYHYSGGQVVHRHPYTAVYDLLFGARRHEPLVLGELGILDNMSMHVWRKYFLAATLFGFEISPNKIAAARAAMLPNTHYALADVKDRASLFFALNEIRTLFDILIDDSTHLFEDQLTFIEVGAGFMKPGGMLIVEDVFRGWEDKHYCDALRPYHRYFSSGTFIDAKHEQSYSGGDAEPYYDNDQLLVLIRNHVPIERPHPTREANLKLLNETLAKPSFADRSYPRWRFEPPRRP